MKEYLKPLFLSTGEKYDLRKFEMVCAWDIGFTAVL